MKKVSCIAAFSLGSQVAGSHSVEIGYKIHHTSCSSTPSSPVAEVGNALMDQCHMYFVWL